MYRFAISLLIEIKIFLSYLKYFYSQRVITPWNKLSQKTVIAESVNALKNIWTLHMGQSGDHINGRKCSHFLANYN